MMQGKGIVVHLNKPGLSNAPLKGTYKNCVSPSLPIIIACLLCRYRQCLANTAGLSLSSVTVTSQQAGSLMLATAMIFPAANPPYPSPAPSLEASLRTNPASAFISDSSFASQYGPVTFDGFGLMGVGGGAAPTPAPPGAAEVEGSLDNPPDGPGLQALGEVLPPIEAARLARIEGYGTFIPVTGYSPPPPSPPPPPQPPVAPPPPGATAAPTVAATQGVTTPTSTPTPTPTGTSSSVSQPAAFGPFCSTVHCI